MLDLLHLPSKIGDGKVSIFTGNATVSNTQWKTWHKPRGVSMVMITCIGGGGGGGGGFSDVAGNPRGGGGSGGSSATTKAIFPAIVLPDTLFIQVGTGGLGVSSGTGGTGTISGVAIAPNTTSTNVVVYSGGAGGAGGVSGTGAAGGAGGAAGTIFSTSGGPLVGLGIYNAIAGQAGVAGGAQTGAVGTAISLAVTSITNTAGSGGAGTQSADFAGGLFTAITSSWLSEQRPATPSAGSFDGSGGVAIWKPLYMFGGGGGSSSNTGIGGNGGNGSYGAGGGGGGGGTTGGRGGDGGSGLVIIQCW